MALMVLVDGAQALKEKELPRWVFLEQVAEFEAVLLRINTELSRRERHKFPEDPEFNDEFDPIWHEQEFDSGVGWIYNLFEVFELLDNKEHITMELSRLLPDVGKTTLAGLAGQIECFVDRLTDMDLYNRDGVLRYKFYGSTPDFIILERKAL